MNRFSWGRFLAVLRKEWIQIPRDPMTLRLIIALLIMQLFLFGYAMNTDPKHLPTRLLSPEHSQYVRSIVSALRNSGYYDIRPVASEAAAERALADGEVLFVINIPPNFEQSDYTAATQRGDRVGTDRLAGRWTPVGHVWGPLDARVIGATELSHLTRGKTRWLMFGC